jgi:hypothetical protein
LVVHVLGAEERFELRDDGIIFEEIIHQLPFLIELSVLFIGPSVGDHVADHDVPVVSHAVTAPGKKVNYSMSK